DLHHCYSSTFTQNTLHYTLSLHDALPIYRLTSHQIRQGFLVEHTLPAGNQCGHQLAKLRFHAALRTIDLVIIMAQGLQDLIERRSEEHTSELQSRENLVCRLLLEKKNKYY